MIFRGDARWALASVLAIALGLRLWGIGFGLPHTLSRPDEEATLSVALRFFGRHLDPGFYHWPPLFIYAVTAAFVAYFNVGRFAGWFPRESAFLAAGASTPAPLFLLARAVSAVAGTVTVWLTYRAGRQLFDQPTALTAAVFLAVAALHVRDSHFGVPDVFATCLALASFVATCRFARTGKTRDVLVSAMWAGLAAAAKYNLALILVPALVLIVTRRAPPDARRGAALRAAWLVLACCLVSLTAFLLVTPFALLNTSAYASGLREIADHLRVGHQLQAGPSWRVHLASTLRYGIGWPMLTAGVAGFAVYCWHERRLGLAFASFPLAYFALIGSGQSAFARYMLPLVPFLALSAAYFVNVLARPAVRLAGTPRLTGVATATFAVLVAVPSLMSSVHMDRLLGRPDTRVLAADRLTRDFPCGATVHQTGSVYGHVQLPTASTRGEFVHVAYDEPSGTFRYPDGTAAPEPDIVIVQESPLPYSRVPPTLRTWLDRGYGLHASIEGVDMAAARPAYDEEDALYLPLSGFGAVSRPGPNLHVYVRRGRPRSAPCE